MLDFNDASKQAEAPAPRNEYAAEDIDTALKNQLRNYILALFPNAQINRGQARIGSLLGEQGESLVIALDGDDAGQWIDHNTDERGNAIQIWQQANNIDFPTALEQIAQWLGLDSRPLKSSPAQIKRNAQPKTEPVKLGAPDQEWHYKDAAGKIIATVKRHDLPDGKKTFRVWDAVAGKAQQPDPKPLYNIPGIIDAAEIIFVEGEKAADALIAEGYAATSLMSGGNSRLDKTDFTYVAGKKCILWPDKDATGSKWLTGLQARLTGLGCAVRAVIPPDFLPEKGDAADCSADQIHAALNTKRFQLRRAGTVKKTPPPAFLIQDYIIEIGMAAIVGPSGSGKSFIGLDIALCTAHGIEWHGLKVKKIKCAVYIAAEGGAGMGSRITAYDNKHGVDSNNVGFHMLPEAINLVDPATDIPDLYETLDEVSPNMIVVDTLARSFAGGDENSTKDMNQFIDNCGKLQARYQCLVIIIHHTGKDIERGARGSSAFKAALDSEFSVKKIKGTEHISFVTSKQKDAPEARPFHLRLAKVAIINEGTGQPDTSCVVMADETIFAGRRQELSPNQRDILSVLEAAKTPLSAEEIIAKSGISSSTVGRFLKEHSKGANPILVLEQSHTQSHTEVLVYSMNTIG